MPELITRQFDVELSTRDDADSPREIVGLSVPYGQIIERYTEAGTQYERFEPGSVEPHPDGHMYFDRHREPVGLVIEERDTPAGYEIRARISDTTAGRDVYTLVRDGVITQHSIGFVPVESRVDKVRLSDDGPEVEVLTRTKVYARETSATPFPAYSKATVTNVRDTETREDTMPDMITREDLTDALEDVRTDVTTIRRELAVLNAGGGAADEFDSIREFRSHGDFLKGLASGEAREAVEVLNRAFEGAVVGDVKGGTAPTWIDRDVKLVEDKRPIVNLFNREALPAEGMSVDYPMFDAKTGDVAKQEAEGDALGMLKLKIKKGSADVETRGGAAELSKQAIERMPASYLNKVLQMIKISYARDTNKVVRAVLLAAQGVNTTVTFNPADAGAVIGAHVDAAGLIEDNSLGLSLDFVLAGRNAFKSLATQLDADGRPIYGVSGQAVNTIGGLNIKAQTLDVGGVPWILDPGMAANANPRACSAEALTVLESPGAPFALRDENIINLTEAFSLYGYLATTLDDPKGIVPFSLTADA